jgi:oligopeptide/dipeptide ABC transporter ATP-binding protein
VSVSPLARRSVGADTVLSVTGLTIEARGGSKAPGKRIVDDVSFDMRRGDVTAIVGESGSGKSTICLAILRILAANVDIVGGSIVFEGEDLTAMSEAQLRKIRGQRIGIVLQDPLSSLDPVRKIGVQLTESRRLHNIDNRKSAHMWAEQNLASLGFAHPRSILKSYPLMLSGGMRQRVCVGIAYSAGPTLLLADEPTTALDVSLQGRLLRLILEQKEQYGTSVLLVSHDIAVVRNVADRVIVMYGGRALETGPVQTVLSDPASPYTRALMATVPTLAPRARTDRLPTIPLAANAAASRGCPFSGRCANEVARCRTEMPPTVEHTPTHTYACWNPRGDA